VTQEETRECWLALAGTETVSVDYVPKVDDDFVTRFEYLVFYWDVSS
jgi:hypothetical protein